MKENTDSITVSNRRVVSILTHTQTHTHTCGHTHTHTFTERHPWTHTHTHTLLHRSIRRHTHTHPFTQPYPTLLQHETIQHEEHKPYIRWDPSWKGQCNYWLIDRCRGAQQRHYLLNPQIIHFCICIWIECRMWVWFVLGLMLNGRMFYFLLAMQLLCLPGILAYNSLWNIFTYTIYITTFYELPEPPLFLLTGGQSTIRNCFALEIETIYCKSI